MERFSGTSLKTRLYFVVLAAFVPVAALIFYVAEEQKAAATDAILQKTRILARTAASVENLHLEAAHNMLVAVCDVFLRMGSRRDALSGTLSDLVLQSGAYMGLGVADSEGKLVARGASSVAIPSNISDRSWFSACLSSGELSLGRYRDGEVDPNPIAYVALPAVDNQGRVHGVAFAALDLNWINRAILGQLAELPKGSRLSLVEETEATLSYDTETEQWTGPTTLNPLLGRLVLTQKSGVLSAADDIGVQRIYAVAPLASPLRNLAGAVVLQIPRAPALRSVTRGFTRNLVLLAICALIATLSVRWAGEVLILRRVRAMVSASRKLTAGDLNARIGGIGGRDELSHLAGAFDEMAVSLQIRMQREQRARDSLEKSREQLRKLAAYQNDVREQERTRIARELHDQFGQFLTILKMDLSWLNKNVPEGMRSLHQRTRDMSEAIDDAMRKLHAVTAELRPVILDDFGLAAAVEWQVEEFRHRTGIECRLEGDDWEPELPRDQATALFRIFQETLTNIIRHAQADRVTVRLERRGGELALEISDNGRGITADQINDPAAFGLLGIRERLRPWGGRVSFEGHPDRGTRVTVWLAMTIKGES